MYNNSQKQKKNFYSQGSAVAAHFWKPFFFFPFFQFENKFIFFRCWNLKRTSKFNPRGRLCGLPCDFYVEE